ncbi:urease accessory protein UreD [Paenibacillus beijingensis]|uniref:Urease accessory protein UreD n=2 Tax=Paenibacillus beijingensis TaxID=1126833 RepID=A0A0D5NRQ6_9BACL|nr:urease accessory protein UreD [Paenibacillus beijingensis]
MEDKYHTAPIKIAKSFPLEDELAVMVMDVSPGMLEGDCYELEWTAGEGSGIYVTNQSFMKVHPCPDGRGAALKQRFSLAPGAFVQHMPEPVMLYKDAKFASDTVVHLAPGSAWMQAEVLCPGRTLRGEVFAYRRFDNRLAVYYGDELIFAQRQRIEPAVQPLSSAGCWDDKTHFGTFYLFSDKIDGSHPAAVREALDALPQTAGREVLYGVTLTHRHGLAVSAAAGAAWPLQQVLEAAWTCARSAVFGKQPLRFRK